MGVSEKKNHVSTSSTSNPKLNKDFWTGSYQHYQYQQQPKIQQKFLKGGSTSSTSITSTTSNPKCNKYFWRGGSSSTQKNQIIQILILLLKRYCKYQVSFVYYTNQQDPQSLNSAKLHKNAQMKQVITAGFSALRDCWTTRGFFFYTSAWLRFKMTNKSYSSQWKVKFQFTPSWESVAMWSDSTNLNF